MTRGRRWWPAYAIAGAFLLGLALEPHATRLGDRLHRRNLAVVVPITQPRRNRA